MSVGTRIAAVVVTILLAFSVETATLRAEPLVNVPGLTLHVAPIADVGARVTFTLSARSWPSRATATIRFVSPNHGFTGTMLWDIRCRCFRVAVPLGKRVHPLETAHVSATVRLASGTAIAAATFQIRGLAPNGRTYAAGGRPLLRGWVGDPAPRRGQDQHYCAWVHASDAFGIQGVGVRFVVHYTAKPSTLSAGKTNVNGVACTHQSTSAATAGTAVAVDVYAGSLHTKVQFTPRA